MGRSMGSLGISFCARLQSWQQGTPRTRPPLLASDGWWRAGWPQRAGGSACSSDRASSNSSSSIAGNSNANNKNKSSSRNFCA